LTTFRISEPGYYKKEILCRDAKMSLYDDKILVTGGLGFIGSHVCVHLLQLNYTVVVIDNFSNASRDVPDKIFNICGNSVVLYEGDLRDVEFIKNVFVKENKFFMVIHLASVNIPDESVSYPIMYYDVNVLGCINLLKVMCDNACKKIIFSSSSKVYGDKTQCPSNENDETRPETPFAKSKVIIEEFLQAQCLADSEWMVAILRVFDSVGSHPSGNLHKRLKSSCAVNFFEQMVKVALDHTLHLAITNNGETKRDYIHVMDTASSIVELVHAIEENKITGTQMINIGTGTSFFDLELVEKFQNSTGLSVPHSYDSDIESLERNHSACTKKSISFLNWKASYSLTDMCLDSIPIKYVATQKYNQHCIDNLRNLCNENLLKCDILSQENNTLGIETIRKAEITAEIFNTIESVGVFYKQWQYVGNNKSYERFFPIATPATL